MEFRQLPRRGAFEGATAGAAGRTRRLVDRALALARDGAERPYAATAAILAANLIAIGLFVAAGELVFADPAELFRELMPGTWLSVAQLGFVAAIAWAIHLELIGERLRLDNLWGVSVVVFCVFAVDEATQLTIFLADALAAAGAVAPVGFKDLDAFLVTVLLLAGGAALIRYGRALLAHPAALVALAIGIALVAGSQALDSLLAATPTEFTAEEGLKLAAEPFLIGAYLIVLHRVTRR